MYDDDLSTVVRNVHRRTEATSRQLANNPLTRAYLEAGVRLLHREFSEPPGDDRFLRPLAGLTRQAVIDEVTNGPTELPSRGTVGSFRDRWEYFPDYLSDLARYTLRLRRWSPYNRLAGEAAPELSNGDFSAAVHEVCFRDMQLVAASTVLRFRFLASALAEHDERVREAMVSVYHDLTATWTEVCTAAVTGRGLTLRPGFTFEELTTILIALAEGLALRTVGDPAAPVLDSTHRRALLGKAALALFIGTVDPGDGSSVDQAADRIARS
jgi:hypothetical protein